MLRVVAKVVLGVACVAAISGCAAEYGDEEDVGSLGQALYTGALPSSQVTTSPTCGKKTKTSPDGNYQTPDGDGIYMVEFTGANHQSVNIKVKYADPLPTTKYQCELVQARGFVHQYVTPPGGPYYWTNPDPQVTGLYYHGAWANGTCTLQPNNGYPEPIVGNGGSPYVSKYRVTAYALYGGAKKRVTIEAKNVLVCIN